MQSQDKSRAEASMYLEELFFLVEDSEIEKLKAVLAEQPHWAKAEMSGFTLLARATRCGQVECVRILLPLSDPNCAMAGSGSTPLMLAAWKGDIDCLRELLAASDPNQRDIAGETALMTAAQCGHLEAVRLLAPKTDASAVDSNGLNALMLAAKSGELGCVKLLVDFCGLEAKNLDGFTALGVAALAAQWDCADFLAILISEEAARELIEIAPPEAELPRCKALIEQAELAQTLRGAQAAVASGNEPLAQSAAPAKPASRRI